MRLLDGFFRINPEELLLFTSTGTHTLLLTPGTYRATIHGAGGAGGANGTNNDYSGGAGGAGGVGKRKVEYFTLTEQTEIKIYVGNQGKTKANGGNGGNGGSGITGGAGGGGGEPSYVKVNSKYYFALGGAGGGGGGGSAAAGRYCNSGGGGGGGGFYRFDSLTGAITSVPGANGGNSGGQNDGEGKTGGAGNTTDFPGVYSAHGGGGGYYKGNRTYGGAGNSGGGAGGGGGGAGAGNHDSSHSGAGGGGAGGDTDAGGGGNGSGSRNTDKMTNAYNVHTTPTSTTDYLGNKQTAKWGVGGTTNKNGTDGWVFIERA